MWKAKYEDLATWCKANNKEYIINEWHPENPFKPEDVTPFSKKKALFICPDCGKEYEMEIGRRTYSNTKCLDCYPTRNTKSLYDWCIENDAQHLLDEWDYEKNDAQNINPKNVSFGKKVAVWWIVNGIEKQMTINHRVGYEKRLKNKK